MSELGEYLRGRREAITPARVGLPDGPRRRTPGLRRAELATLAGVSVEYLTRLEQGRDRHPSPQVLGALADALRLDVDQRFHLHLLAKPGGGLVCSGRVTPASTVRPTVRALLDRLEPAPAYVVNRLGSLIAYTEGFRRLARPVGLLDGDPPSLHRFLFTDPRARTAYPDWERRADEAAAALRFEARDEGDEHTRELVDWLSVAAGGPFIERLSQPPALARATGVHRLVHPEVGELSLAYETLDLPAGDYQQLVVYLPADEATGAALDAVTDRLAAAAY
ncbi:helix-turn-helix transcriptional regulator [Phytohabitans sp. ZYX-F-186]|uniref:Helix-turn-helix transcriptional regulator n=1 Tax=Phytohabitans maris TaxID=3071409 RepID=A0ABU0ZUL6_9ACTN|nr:helix-turn-helix transcriptional regulator [Phytohabitans sp. ZYX-F-186]MDQ7910738.1 helix-turn-helix transcriptional regulator [Phytohabitans sp. ZYX-F-186]